MQRLPDVMVSLMQSTATSPVYAIASPEEVAKMAKKLLGCFRTGEANDPAIYTAAVIAVLSDYPFGVIGKVVDPRNGLPSKCKWLPTIAEIKEACEKEMAPLWREAERRKRLAAQFAERDEYERKRRTSELEPFRFE